MMRSNYSFAAVAVIVLGFALGVRIFVRAPDKTLVLNERKITAEVADTPYLRGRGLSGRASLSADRGMLFVFSKADRHAFWMINMKFPIDIVWLNAGKVVDIAKNVPPPAPGAAVGDLTLYTPRLPADRVLEVPAGTAEASGLKIGDLVGGL